MEIFMSRSNFAIPYIDPAKNVAHRANCILVENGFEEVERDNELVWIKDNDEITSFLKFDYQENVFIFSTWIKYKNDINSHIEYSLDFFDYEWKESKDLVKVIDELQSCFDGRLSQKKLYILV